MGHEMQVKGTGSWCVLVEYVKENYYALHARFHDPSYHRYREINCRQKLMDRRKVELLYCREKVHSSKVG